MIWSLALALHLYFAAAANHQACDRALTTVDLERCAKLELEHQNARMLDQEKGVRGKLSPPAVARFDSATIAWRTYREVECRAVYDHFSPGTVAPVAYLGCKIALTKDRRSILSSLYSPDF